ncbi:MAG: hypothetical protein JO001_07435 [Alphaproteobacteria bacterium]|nr:hypothetical protein [Alphaproteobacteria bacterium]
MPTMRGTITIAQESRFQMVEHHGATHLFTLAPNASSEPAQIAALAARQARVRVKYRRGDNVLANVAERIDIDLAPEIAPGVTPGPASCT